VPAIGFALEQPAVARRFDWCQSLFSSHDRVPAPVGVAAWVLLAAMAVAAAHHLHRRRSALAVDDQDLIDTDAPLAFAVPGRLGSPGRVVVSTGMLRSLDEDERAVLFAHERAHLDHHHHRFLRIAETASAAVPFLRPISREVRFATERWADEEAAAELGDRKVVARAIARAALASSAPAVSAQLTFTGTGALARVDAMLRPPAPSRRSAAVWTAAALIALWTSMSGSTLQLHHLVQFLAHVCPLR
jgi:beta-lactamase regulating signal transducer with metallopeptidase domain